MSPGRAVALISAWRVDVKSRLAARWAIVVAVMDRSRLSRAGRVVLPLTVLLALGWSGSSPQPQMTGAPPGQSAVRAILELADGIFGGQVQVVGPASLHGQRHRRGGVPVVLLAAVLAGAVAATTRREWLSRPRRLDGWVLAVGQRAPPSWRL